MGYGLEGSTAYLMSLGATFVGAGIFSLTRMRHGRVPQEAIIGIVYAVSAAAAVLTIDRAPHGAEHIKHMLVGSILWVSWADVLRMAAVYLVVGAFHWVLRERFITISMDEGEAARRGWAIRAWDFVFYASFGLVISISVPIAGVLLVFSFLIVPAVCGTLLSDRIPARLAIAWAIGFLVSALGCTISFLADLPTGATVVCVFGVVLIVLALVRGVFTQRR
jgi:zinc/manganese transport system permease protein